ncbi:MAG: hypothetical protein M1820_001813 [Bogoriella megaspora]|nr:MAG: hypothetical protein M1820_001813 [Bogoriella megaspora]
MSWLWITLSTRWDLASVQAALNVVIAVLGTTSIWSFTRFWWQRASLKVLNGERIVPLSKLLTFSGPGEGWDLMTLLRRQLFAKENWHLLAQLLVVIGITAATGFAGPISKVSLRNGETIVRRSLQGLQTSKGAGPALNLLNANVLWNETIQSLNYAEFPFNQVMDFVPPTNEPWVFQENEWEPTWHVRCNQTEPTVIANLYGDNRYTFADPLNAFPAFRDTLDSAWLNTGRYRVTTDFCGWDTPGGNPSLKDAVFYILVQSNPEADDQMYLNKNPLELSISALHVSNGNITISANTITGRKAIVPTGRFQQALYSRSECLITRNAQVEDEDSIPWIWTNDTTSIAQSYADYNRFDVEQAAGRNLTVPTPSADDLLRFYQAYIASITTNTSRPTPKTLSVRLRTVELSSIFLGLILLLFLLTLWGSVRYLVFFIKHKTDLEKTYVPDGKLEWMLHAVKTSTTLTEQMANQKDREHFRSALFGCEVSSNIPPIATLARIYSNQDSLWRARTGDQSTRSQSAGTQLPRVAGIPQRYHLGECLAVRTFNKSKPGRSKSLPLTTPSRYFEDELWAPVPVFSERLRSENFSME